MSIREIEAERDKRIIQSQALMHTEFNSKHRRQFINLQDNIAEIMAHLEEKRLGEKDG